MAEELTQIFDIPLKEGEEATLATEEELSCGRGDDEDE